MTLSVISIMKQQVKDVGRRFLLIRLSSVKESQRQPESLMSQQLASVIGFLGSLSVL